MAIIRLPGLIDLHTHLRDPGQTHKENFTTGTRAALTGGFTTIFDMPNNAIPITTRERIDGKIELAQKKICCDVGFYFGSVADNLDEFAKVKDRVWGLKLYLNETTGSFLFDTDKLEQTFKAWKKSLHTTTLYSDKVKTEKPILVHAEMKLIETIISLVKKTNTRTHFCHISSKGELSMIIKAKEEGLPITCGVTPHHLFLTDKDALTLGPYGMMKPPLRSKKDQDFLWEHLENIDVIESDHAPHTKEEKESTNPPFGVPGLETTLPLLLTAVTEKRLTIEDIIRLCHEGPKAILGLQSDQQTYTEVNTTASYIIKNSDLFTKCKWSPFDSWRVVGKVQKVVVRGITAFEEGEIKVDPGFGHVLTPQL